MNINTAKITSKDIELVLSKYFNIRVNIIVPNVSWGLFNHECDLIVLTKSGYCTEVEIKISKQDLLNDLKKKHKHNDKLIHSLYFAIPEHLIDCLEHIPEHAGVLVVNPHARLKIDKVKCLRRPVKNSNLKWNDKITHKLLRLSNMRVWSLKAKLNKILKKKQV